VAKKVLEKVRMPLDLNGNEARIGASIGIAFYPDHGHSAEAVLKQADIAMYSVKEGGKNAYALACADALLPGITEP
jgi:diguanylate cyclase (GGDEF)-like protein